MSDDRFDRVDFSEHVDFDVLARLATRIETVLRPFGSPKDVLPVVQLIVMRYCKNAGTTREQFLQAIRHLANAWWDDIS